MKFLSFLVGFVLTIGVFTIATRTPREQVTAVRETVQPYFHAIQEDLLMEAVKQMEMIYKTGDKPRFCLQLGIVVELLLQKRDEEWYPKYHGLYKQKCSSIY